MSEWNPRSWKYWEGNVIGLVLVGGFVTFAVVNNRTGKSLLTPEMSPVTSPMHLIRDVPACRQWTRKTGVGSLNEQLEC